MIGLLTMLTGGRTCVDMHEFGVSREPWLRTFMGLGHGVPSHDAFSDLFRALDPSSLQTALLRMAQDWGDALGDVVAVDGKALRRSFEDAAARSPLHLVQAFAAKAKLTLAQVEVADKSNEIPALPKLLELIDVKGRVVTADAMHAQRETSAAVVAGGGDCVLALKGSQEAAARRCQAVPGRSAAAGKVPFASRAEPGKGHGRIECRTATHVLVRRTHVLVRRLPRHRLAPGAALLARPRGHRQGGRGAAPEERQAQCGNPLLHPQREALRRALRAGRAHPLGHRERRRFASDACHWVLDVTMNEDQARNRKGNGAHCLAVMRRLALNIARLHPGKQSMRVKFLKGLWSHDFLLDMIRATRRCE